MQKNSGVMTKACVDEYFNFCRAKKTHNKQNKNKGGGDIIMWMQFRIKGRGRAGASLATKYTTTLQHQVFSVCNL